MAQEIELKLSLPPSAQQQLLQHPLLQQLSIADREQRQLFNIYFDTPNQALNQHRVALRIRRQGERFIQTLKSKGISSGGLHQRQEWEWDLPEAKLDIALLPPQSLPESVVLADLQPAFNTDFLRTAWQLEVKEDNRQARIELVLDHGFAVSGDHPQNHDDQPASDPISEIELELVSGDPLLIFTLALELAKTIPLRITRVSKAERGYRLQRKTIVQHQQIKPFAGNASDHPSALLEYLLECCQSLIENFEFDRSPGHLYPLLLRLQELQALISTSPIVLTTITSEQLAQSCQQLQQLLAPWILEQQYPNHYSDEADRKQRLEHVQQLLKGQPLAQCLLQLSYRVFLDNRR